MGFHGGNVSGVPNGGVRLYWEDINAQESIQTGNVRMTFLA